jgi:hypothetical protein
MANGGDHPKPKPEAKEPKSAVKKKPRAKKPKR